MTDDEKYAELFKGRPGSVLGGFRNPEPQPDPEPTEKKSGFSRAKERMAAEKRLPPRRGHGGRLPPGQEIVKDWPVLDLGHQPYIPLDQWTLTVAGAVERPVKWTLAQFMGEPQVRVTADIHCVTAWSRLGSTFEGIATRHLIRASAPTAGVKFVVLHAHDGYRTNVPMARFAAENALLAHACDGEPLSREHGGPVRAVLPDLYFWKSAKWLRQITFLEKDAPGYWESRGYHNEGDPWKEERFE